MKALVKILHRLGAEKGSQSSRTTAHSSRSFELWYDGLKVGRLEEDADGWVFAYTEDFRKQDHVQTLADFPRKSKYYRFNELWPFFASRIPSLEQPKVQRQLREEKIDATDIGALLQRYGKRSIANSFVLRDV